MVANYDALARLSRIAERLRADSGFAKGPPSLLFFTDPLRIPNPLPIVAALPPGAGVVYRPFGRPDALTLGAAIARITAERGLALFVGADPDLALALGADGLHLPERLVSRLPRLRRTLGRRIAWITAAAHSASAAHAAARSGADAVVLSTVFASVSASAGRPLGPLRAASIARSIRAPAIALGGIDARTGPKLMGLGWFGIAGVDGFAADVRTSGSTRT